MTRIAILCSAFAAGALAALPLDVSAQAIRCVGKDGKKYYQQTLPQACIGQPYEQLNSQGMVIRRVTPRATAAEEAAKAEEEKRKREAEIANREEDRRRRALLATYTSVEDIESARARALQGNGKEIEFIEKQIAAIKAKQAKYAKEMASYKGKTAPSQLVQDIRNAKFDLESQESVLASKQKEVTAINAKYDADKKRYIEVTKPQKR